MENSKLQGDAITTNVQNMVVFFLILMKKWKWSATVSHLYPKPRPVH